MLDFVELSVTILSNEFAMQPIDEQDLTSQDLDQGRLQESVVEKSKTLSQTNGDCFDIAGEGFVLKGYSPTGQQMARRLGPFSGVTS